MTEDKNPIIDLAYKQSTEDFETRLRAWWSSTYKRPMFHDSLDEYSIEELLLEFYITKFITDEDFKKEYEAKNNIRKKEDEEFFKKMMGKDYVDEDIVHDSFE